MYGLNKYMIDINIETLAGTTFSLKVSPHEPIQSVKAKIQRLEGIPISHQHLVWKTTELEDNCCLNDYNVPNGATIKMVLALRGGPINTRRMTTEDSLLRDVSDLMEIREDSNLWNTNDSSQSLNKHVTLLLFRDGDHLNLLRVIDRGDAASPISGAMSAASMYVPYDETDHERILTNQASGTAPDGTLIESDVKLNSKKLKYKKSLTSENEKTREKMMALRDKMNEYKRQKTRNNKQANEPATSVIAANTTTTTNTATNLNKTQLEKSETTTIKQDQSDSNELADLKSQQKHNQQETSQLPIHSAKINSTNSNANRSISNNLRMKRFQIIGDSSKLLPPNDVVNKKLSSATNTSGDVAVGKQEEKQASTSTKQAKAKLTTIYTTTDRNGQVFIKKIHENYAELGGDEVGDDEVDEEDQEDEDLDSDEDIEDEYDENYDEEGVDYEANLLKNYNCYYEDEYFVDDGEVDYDDVDVDDEEEDEEDEDEDDDEEEDEVDEDLDDEEEDDDDELDDELDDEEDAESTKLKTAMCEDDYDEDENENELLLNKSELLINEDRQTNNSPNSGGVNETNVAVNSAANGGSADLMTMMMMMTLNSDQMSLNGGAASGIGIHGGVSSSLATTALPTILTPMYTTDNENFIHPPTRSAMKKMKSLRMSNGKKAQSISNHQLNNKVVKSKRSKALVNSNTLDIIQIETNNNTKMNSNSNKTTSQDMESSNAELEKLKQIETLVQEERLAAARLQKQKRKKKRIQLQLQQLKEQELQNKLGQEITAEQQQQSNDMDNSNKKETLIDDQNTNQQQQKQLRRVNPRRRRRREYSDSKPNIQFSSILLLPEEIESIKRRMKEGIELKQQQQQQQQLLSRQSRNQTSLKLSSDKEKSILVDNSDKSQTSSNTQQLVGDINTQMETKIVSTPPNNVNNNLDESSQYEKAPPMPSTLQKRVSFIVTPTDEEKSNQASLLASNDYLEKMKKILKSSPNSTNRTTASLQAKVFNSELQQPQQQQPLPPSQQQIKPLLLTNYKQKPPPKLDSLYSSNEIVTFSNVNTNNATGNKFYHQQSQEISNENINNGSKMFANLNNKTYPSNEGDSRMPTQPNSNLNVLKRNSAALRNISTPTSSPTTTSTSINRLDILKTNLAYSGNSVLKNYSSAYANTSTSISSGNGLNKYNETTSVEPLRLSSASARASKSLSTNDMSSKALKLPPVITNTSTNSSNSNILIGGSANSLTTIGLNETGTSKKKITDLSRYCYFCQRKTGLASSYICRCGNNYCTQHRNAEAHNCTFDYKTEGRKLIEHANPLVAAPKLPKI